jgi:hypothetical protein
MASSSREHPLGLMQFPFAAGIDEANRSELVDAGAGWAVLENGRQDKRGGYSTRPGFTALANGLIDATSPTAGYKLLTDRGNPVRIADGTAQVYDAKSATWKSLGRVPDCSVGVIDLPTMGTVSTVEDHEQCNGYVAVAYRVTNPTLTAFATVLNATTWATVRAPEPIGSASANIRAILLGSYSTYFIMLVLRPADGTILGYYLDTSTAATITTGWVAIGASVKADVATTEDSFAVESLSNRVAFAYRNNSGGASALTVSTLTSAGVVETQTVTATAPTAIDVAGSISDTLWVAWVSGSDAKIIGLDADSLASTLATTATLFVPTGSTYYSGIATSATAGKGRLVVSTTTGLTIRSFQITGGAAATDGAATIVPSAHIAGRPFRYGTRYFVPAYGGATNDQDNCILVDISESTTYVRPVAIAVPGLANLSVYLKGRCFLGVNTDRRYFGIGITRSAAAVASGLFEYDFASANRWASTTSGNATILSGGVLTCLDGTRVAESGFLIRPDKPTTSLGGTGIDAAVGYRYICAYEEVDADGNWSISGLSTPSDSTGIFTNKAVTVLTSPLSISSRVSSAPATSARVAFYRTADNGGIAPYYRIGATINNTSGTTVGALDFTTDAVLTTASKLYSQPGVLGTAQDKRPSPGLSCLVSYNGMVVGAAGSDIWFSGQTVAGEGLWFNPIFQVPVPGEGEITALWVMDGTLYVAKRRELYTINGEAPSDNGSSGGLGQPRRLAVDVGCTNPRSVCVSALGTFFQSERGIELMTRAQTVDWIGEPVQDTLTSYPIVTSATVEPVSSTVLIECAASESSGLVGGSGRTLVFDLSVRCWVSTDRRTSSAGTADAPSQSACVVYTGTAYRYAWLTTTGVVHYETPSTYLDANGSMVCKRAISANVKAGGVQGHQHVNKTLLLSKYHTPHDLNMSFAYDYSSTFKTARLYTAAQLLTVSTALPNLQLEHLMHDDARCESVRVQLQDVTPSSGTLGTGQGGTWIALAFEVVPQTGAYGLPDASR